MLPKAHILYGAILAIGSWFLFPNVTSTYAALIFLSSFLIDFDHYMWYVIKKKDWSLKNAYYYLKDEIIEQHQLMIFHTVEFLILVGVLSFIWIGFYYILVGMLYHSALDVIEMTKEKTLMNREYSLIYHYIRK